MNNKYFTPEISDLFVGYETTIFTPSEFEQPYYKDIILSKNDLTDIFKFNGDLRNGQGIPLDFLKTLYLTKENIEKEDWKLDNFDNDGVSWFKKDNYELVYFDEYKSTHSMIIKYFGDTFFQGKIKSINEFKKLLKMLDI